MANKQGRKWICEVCGWTYWRMWCKEWVPRLQPRLLGCGIALAAVGACAPLCSTTAGAAVPRGPTLLVAAATLLGVLCSG